MSKNLIALQNKFLGQGTTIYDVLSRVHASQGFVGDVDIERLAREHNLPPAHVRAVAKFYDELAQERPASRSLKVCNGEACRAAGCDGLVSELSAALAVEQGGISAAGVRFEHVSCLGYCGLGPSAMVDGAPVSLADPAAVAAVLADLAGGPPHGLSEPKNQVYAPEGDAPCVLLRHVGCDVVDLAAARARGIYATIERVRQTSSPQQVIDEVKASGLRGRGGAGFPTGIKLQTVHDSEAPDGSGRRFVVINFDEGDAGSYIDKELVERDPHTQIEGILLACFAVGAREAFVYARYEYPTARAVLAGALAEAQVDGVLGDVTIHLVRGQGAYICGEETSLLRSLEGVPALVSIRPPFPAQQGLWSCPTAVNNVETVHNLPWIVSHGGKAYAEIGYGRSRGTKLVSLNTRVARPGVYEVPFGTTLRAILDLAGGMAAGQRCVGVQIGGPLGGILPATRLDTPLDFEAVAAAGGIVGHAGMVFFSQNDDLFRLARGLMQFCAVESCGKCFPCRIGAVRGTELFDQMLEQGVNDARLALLRDLCETMTYGSLCAMGSMTPAPILSVLDHFPDAVARYRKPSAAPSS